VEFKIAQNVLV